jgi:hypothetical protein
MAPAIIIHIVIPGGRRLKQVASLGYIVINCLKKKQISKQTNKKTQNKQIKPSMVQKKKKKRERDRPLEQSRVQRTQ